MQLSLLRALLPWPHMTHCCVSLWPVRLYFTPSLCKHDKKANIQDNEREMLLNN